MFQHLDLSEQEKLRYFLQGLRREIRQEILIKQPKTYREAEDVAKLIIANGGLLYSYGKFRSQLIK